MKDIDLDRIARDPKFAPAKRKGAQKTRSVKDLFEDVDQEPVFKDKRGRPWVKNPRAFVKAQLAKSKSARTAQDEAEEPEKMDVDDHVEEREEEENVELSAESSSDDDSDGSRSSSGDDSMSSSSSDPETERDPLEVIADLQEADWHELTKDAAPATNIGKRLALLHFDWDNAKAENIYMVLESFLPPKGHIERVTIYPSEFGIKRMAEEAVRGPLELVEKPSDNTTANAVEDAAAESTEAGSNSREVAADEADPVLDLDDKSSWRKAPIELRRRIRQYQLARLKYFYAIIEFDSAETAEAVYNACDGYEYESSGAKFDLRFVDDHEEFSVPPEHAHLVSECREINKAKYNPRPFETSALHSTRIGVTWDKTPAERTCWLRDQFKPDVDPIVALTENRDELEKYVVLSSSGASTAASSDVDEEPPAPTVPRIRRHRPKKLPPEELRAALLSAIGLDPSRPFDDRDEQPEAQVSKVNRTSGGDPAAPPVDEGSEDDEEQEEVFDLNEASDLDVDNEEYYLGPMEKKASKHSLLAQGKSDPTKRKKKGGVRRRVLPEALDDQPFDSSASSDEEPQVTGNTEDAKSRKRKYKEKQRNKMRDKRRKVQERLERQAKLWKLDDDGAEVSNCDEDDRFDQFLIDPAFKISQTHPDYKEAVDFLRYMRRRKVARQQTTIPT